MHTGLKSILVAGALALAAWPAAAADTFMDAMAALDRTDYATALRIFGEGAGRDDAKSQFALAEMYRQGQGVSRNPAMARLWYGKAADHGLPGAAFRLGTFYEDGQGVARDDRAAAMWYAKAADRGYASAEVKLGRLYAEGRGVPQSDATAAAWFQKAADQGDADGSLQLARTPPDDGGPPRARFHAMMDRVFGAGRWRETGGYRTQAKENELRKEGAGTVPAGQRSRHSVGNAQSPGAYDIVVAGMAPERAAAKLKAFRDQLTRVVVERAHGTQGPHLHVEPQPSWMKPAREDAGPAGSARLLLARTASYSR